MINPSAAAGPAKPSATPPYTTLALMFLGTRLVILLVAGLSLLVINKGRFFSPPSGVLGWFTRWDAGWYLQIAEIGYTYDPSAQSSVAFFPLYPWLTGLLSPCGGLLAAGYLISNTALYGTLVFLWRWVFAEYADRELATLTCWFLLIGPVSFFFSTVYTESLFLFLVLGSLYLGRQQRWLLAGLLGYCASLTRNLGFFLFLPLLWEYYAAWRAADPAGRRIRLYPILCCLVPALGLVTYMGFLWFAFDDPLAFAHVQSNWARKFAYFWKPFLAGRVAHMEPFFRYWFFGIVAVTVAATAVGAWLRVRPLNLLLIVGPLFLYLSTNNLESIPRYISVLFPLYLIAALLARKSALLEKMMTAVSVSMLALSTIQFVNGYWFT